MAETSEIIDGQLKLTKTGDSVTTTMTRKEVIGKKAEAQTEVDHLIINLAAKEAEVTEWNDYLKQM